MKQPVRYILLLLALMICRAVSAQQNDLLTGHFNGAHFDDVVKGIEQQSGYYFYYDKHWTDSLSVNVIAQRMPIQDLLEQVLAGTDLYFAIDPNKRIFITRERPVYAQLPPGFYGDPTGQASREPAFDFSLYEKKEKELKLAETKVHRIGGNTGEPGPQGQETGAQFVDLCCL
jgi:hypothetical protein